MDTGLTLLGHVVPRVTSQVEDAASEALAFILNKSAACRGALGGSLQVEGFEPETISWVATQISFEDGSCPDVIGYDERNESRLFIEAKFWAGLTDRQPNAYLANLPPTNLQLDRTRLGKPPAVLIFVVPTARLGSLWCEVKSRAEEKFELKEKLQSGDLRSAAIEDDNRHLMMTGWRDILGILHDAAVSGGEKDTQFEIAQLRGLVDYMEMDTSAFLPLSEGELEPDIPRRMLSLMRLVDEAVERVQAEEPVSLHSPPGGGYGKNFTLNGVRVWFGVYQRKWAQHGMSPLWVYPWCKRDREFLRNNHCKTPLNDADHFPVDLPIGVDYNAVLEETVSQIKKMARLFKERADVKQD